MTKAPTRGYKRKPYPLDLWWFRTRPPLKLHTNSISSLLASSIHTLYHFILNILVNTMLPLILLLLPIELSMGMYLPHRNTSSMGMYPPHRNTTRHFKRHAGQQWPGDPTSFPPYPPMSDSNGNEKGVEDLYGVRIYGWLGCYKKQQQQIIQAYEDWLAIVQPLGDGNNWDTNWSEDFWGMGHGENKVPKRRRKEIEAVFKAMHHMGQVWWAQETDPKKLWIEVCLSAATRLSHLLFPHAHRLMKLRRWSKAISQTKCFC